MSREDFTFGARYMYRRLALNGKLNTTSMAQFSDDGGRAERERQRPLVDLMDEAILLWQSERPHSRAGKWPSDAVMDRYAKYIRMKRNRGDWQ